MTEPPASSTAQLTKFSDAISSSPLFWRCRSSEIAFAISGSASASVRQSGIFVSVAIKSCRRPVALRALLLFLDLIEPPLVASTLEGGLQPQLENLVGEPERDDASAHREHVGVVVLARQPRGIEVVAERGADAAHLVGGDLLALTAAAQHDAAFGAAVGDGAADGEADRRVIDRFLAVGAEILDVVSEPGQRVLQVLLQLKAGMVGADGDAHGRQLYYVELGMVPAVVISTRGEERLRSGHPWIYRADVADSRAAAGDIVEVRSARGRTLGSALFSDRSQITLRMLAYG